jgi:hypothetical protein
MVPYGKYTGSTVIVRPKSMTVEQLQAGYKKAFTPLRDFRRSAQSTSSKIDRLTPSSNWKVFARTANTFASPLSANSLR